MTPNEALVTHILKSFLAWAETKNIRLNGVERRAKDIDELLSMFLALSKPPGTE